MEFFSGFFLESFCVLRNEAAYSSEIIHGDLSAWALLLARSRYRAVSVALDPQVG